MNHKLYIIEGLPCSGKSTTSAFVADLLKAEHPVCFVDEGSGEHPADFEFHAFLSESELPGFSVEEQEKIKKSAESMQGGYIVPLAQFEGELFERLLPHKIYDFLPWETEMPVMLAKWQNFCKKAVKTDTVHVFNCVLLQNPMCETMMRFGFTSEQSQAYISEIAKIIQPLHPAVIYLKNDDIQASVEKAAKEREGWLDAVIDYHVNGAYGKSIGAEGFDGYIRCLEERQKRELEILSQLPVTSHVIENPQRDWDDAYDTIRKWVASET